MGKTTITIDYTKCGENGEVDPRACCKCLKVCDPAVFLMHPTIGAEEKDPHDPQHWRITPVWLSVCSRCGKCIDICPEDAIEVSW